MKLGSINKYVRTARARARARVRVMVRVRVGLCLAQCLGLTGL